MAHQGSRTARRLVGLAGLALPCALLPGLAQAADAGAMPERVALVKLALALAGTALLGWGAWLARRGRGAAHARLRDGLLAALGVAGLLAWSNFFQFHYPQFAHVHELYHYVIGAKYFPELGYTRLYACTAVADAQDGLGQRVAARQITDLRTYDVVSAAPILAAPGRCTRHFSPERWALFRRDVRWFRERLEPEDWEKLQRDHGYNPTPVWTALGGWLVDDAPVAESRLLTLVTLDPLLEVMMWGFALWAFGWRATCVAALYWGTNQPADFAWIGGAFLREGWLAASVIGICLLRHRRAVAAGFLLGTAGLLRVFPFLLWLPLAWQALDGAIRARRPVLSPVLRGLGAGGALALLTLVPLSLALGGGADAWRGFGRNIALHVRTPTINAVGLNTLLSFRPAQRFAELEHAVADPGRAWKQARRERSRQVWPWRAALAAGLVALVCLAARREEPWVAAVLGVGLLPVLLDPSSYYSVSFLAFGFLWLRAPSIGAALCALSAAGRLGPTSMEENLAWVSLAMLAFVAYSAFALLRTDRAAAP